MLAAQSKALEIPPTESPVKSGDSWKRIVEGIEPFLKEVSSFLKGQVQEFEPEIAEMAAYALAAQGKQLRSSLVALSADAAGGRNSDHITVAAIIEMVHLATLVHDDVIDEAKVRRGQPTLTANWGNEVSVLLGDCLFAHSLKLAASFPTPEICRAVATATNVVCSGEILQTQQRWKFNMTRAEYLRIVAMKTAELFALSCEQGAFLAKASPEVQAALRNYGMALGT
ncbi:MAG: polyprenyl synthetase family protein, partial [Limisphaerales bacterium]